eukprot:1608547-Amphidinium_carterae.1
MRRVNPPSSKGSATITAKPATKTFSLLICNLQDIRSILPPITVAPQQYRILPCEPSVDDQNGVLSGSGGSAMFPR